MVVFVCFVQEKILDCDLRRVDISFVLIADRLIFGQVGHIQMHGAYSMYVFGVILVSEPNLKSILALGKGVEGDPHNILGAREPSEVLAECNSEPIGLTVVRKSV